MGPTLVGKLWGNAMAMKGVYFEWFKSVAEQGYRRYGAIVKKKILRGLGDCWGEGGCLPLPAP